MRFYDTHYEDYCNSLRQANLHPELLTVYDKLPSKLNEFPNMILYGPSGSGKYSQALYVLQRYSPSHLKYEKKMTASTEKQSYNYKISDIHYEVDMGLLGCNSKLLWHEIFLQIVDIISMKQDKVGVIVCKNFHQIHNELLEIFYSYMQHYSENSGYVSGIQIKFILLTEHVSFLPNNILNACFVLGIGKPSKTLLSQCIGICKTNFPRSNVSNIIESVAPENILNSKEIYSFALVKSVDELPKDHFNVICDNIIEAMENYDTMIITQFRDNLYDVLIYNIDVYECIWFVFSYFVQMKKFQEDKIPDLLMKMTLFLQQYGNNYRSIFHLENICFAMICCFIPVKI